MKLNRASEPRTIKNIKCKCKQVKIKIQGPNQGVPATDKTTQPSHAKKAFTTQIIRNPKTIPELLHVAPTLIP